MGFERFFGFGLWITSLANNFHANLAPQYSGKGISVKKNLIPPMTTRVTEHLLKNGWNGGTCCVLKLLGLNNVDVEKQALPVTTLPSSVVLGRTSAANFLVASRKEDLAVVC